MYASQGESYEKKMSVQMDTSEKNCFSVFHTQSINRDLKNIICQISNTKATTKSQVLSV